MSSLKENKMGTMPIGRLLLTMAIPIVISMLVQALYNVVDSVFVAQLSEDALNAVSLAFPVQNLMIAVAVGTGVGINALLSKSLGEGNQAKADRTAMNGLFLSALSFLVFAVIGLTCSRLYFTIQTDIQRIVDYGESYMMICCVCSFGVFFQITLERTLQATGRTLYTMFTQATGAIINIILDPIMIFGLFGFPRLEVAGAAVATVAGQILAAILAIIMNLKKNPDIHIVPREIRWNTIIAKEIYRVGFPSIVMQSISSIMTYCMNLILVQFTVTATAVFGVYFKLQSFFFMPVFGLNNGITPIIAYNYGAGQRKRMLKTIKLSMLVAFCLTFIGFLCFEGIPQILLGMFNASDEMLTIGVPALRIIGIHYLIAWFCIVSGTVFQALGKAFFSMIVSIMRQLFVLIPAAYILAKLGGLHVVWWSFPIAEIISLMVSSFFLVRINRTIISRVPEGKL